MPSKQELLDSIRPGIKLTRDFFIKIYGYELSYPGFAETALARLERIGSTKSREHYSKIAGECMQEYENVMKNTASWLAKQEKWLSRKKGVRDWRENLTKMSDSDLIAYLENSIKED